MNSSFAELVLSDPIKQVAEQAEVSTLPGAVGQQRHPGAKTSIQHGWTQEKTHSYYLAMRTTVQIKEKPQKSREKNCLLRSEIDVHVIGLSVSYSRAKEMSLDSAVPV